MNTIDANVTEIVGRPEYKYGKWFVRCKVSSYGHESETEAMFYTEADALALTIGDTVII